MDALTKTLFTELVSVLEEEGIEESQVKMETNLKELELSSMQFLRVVGALEDLLEIPLDAGLGDVESVGDLIGELRKLKEAQG